MRIDALALVLDVRVVDQQRDNESEHERNRRLQQARDHRGHHGEGERDVQHEQHALAPAAGS